MRLVFSCFVIFVTSLLSGCSTTEPVVATESPKEIRGVSPEIGVASQARVGDKIYEAFNYKQIHLPKRTTLSTGLRRKFVLQTIDAPAGSEVVQNSQGEYCSVEKLLIDPLVGAHDQICFTDDDKDGAFDKVGATPGVLRFWKDLETPIPYKLNVSEALNIDAGGYKKELIYQGRDGSTLRVSYREYLDNLARPAFTQDLTYPIISGKSEIIFQNLKIEVTSIQPSELTDVVREGAL